MAADALFCVGNFLHTALLLECVERSGDLARRQQFDGRFQSGVLLAHDLIESGGTHSGFLQLLERAARFDALMLTDIADQKHAILSDQAAQETRASDWCWQGSIHRQGRSAFALVGRDSRCG